MTIRAELVNTIATLINDATGIKQGAKMLAEEIVDEVLCSLPVKPGRNYTVDKACARIRATADAGKPISLMDCEIVMAAYHSLTDEPQQLNTDLFRPLPDDGGWFDWNGEGTLPVDPGTRVEFQMRNGRMSEVVLAGNVMWQHDKEHLAPWDIVKYRVIQENNLTSSLDMAAMRNRLEHLKEVIARGDFASANVEELFELAQLSVQEAEKQRDVNLLLLK